MYEQDLDRKKRKERWVDENLNVVCHLYVAPILLIMVISPMGAIAAICEVFSISTSKPIHIILKILFFLLLAPVWLIGGAVALVFLHSLIDDGSHNNIYIILGLYYIAVSLFTLCSFLMCLTDEGQATRYD